jgi:uncharacterized membrane protein
MSEVRLRWAAAALATAGTALSAYLLYARETGRALACATGGCETVQGSRYAEVLGVPVAGLGLVAYVVLLLASLNAGELARMLGAAVALAGVAFGAYLLYVQLAVIEAVCQWCLASDVLMTGLAAAMLLRIKVSALDAHPPPR